MMSLCKRHLVKFLQLIATINALNAGVNFSHRNSTINVGSGKLIVNTPITNWNGTLQQTGSVVGQPISFNQGVLENNGTPALFTGSYAASSPQQVVLTSNQLISIQSGQFAPNIYVSRSGNRLQGQPVFQSSTAITLGNNLSGLTLALNSPLTSSIAMNGGTITCDGDVNLVDDRLLTGSGTVNVNGRRFMFGGPLTSSSLKLTHTLRWNDASAVEINGPLLLSGSWLFASITSGNQPTLIGNGNILDLTQRGSIFVAKNTTLNLANIKIKGFGRGGFVLQDSTSQVRLHNVEIEMANSYTVTSGGIYVDGISTIVTKSGLLNFSLRGSLTVDGVTLWYDPVNGTDLFNIRPLIGSSTNSGGNKFITYLNSGIIRGPGGDNTLIRTVSNASLACCRHNSNTLLFLNRTNSNTNVFQNTQIRTNSNAFARGIRNNSNAILLCCRTLSNALLFGDRTNSNTNVFQNTQIRTQSNAFARGIRNNSNAILLCCRTLSNSIINQNNNIRTFSNAQLFGDRTNSNALLACCRTLSNALLFGDRTNSNTNVFQNTQIRTQSNAFARGIRNNSNAILLCCRTLSNALLFGDRTNSNTNVFQNTQIRTQSNAFARGIRNNSNAILLCCRTLSNALLFGDRTNSNTNVFQNTQIRTQSNAFARGIRNNSNAILACCRTLSNSILYVNRTNSNAIINISNITRTNSNAFARGIRNNSNAILLCCRTLSNALLECCTNNSNAIVNITNPNNTNSLASFIRYVSNAHLFLERTDSATKLFLARNNSNAIINLARTVRTNSNAFARGIRNNSNAILLCCRTLSNSILYLTKNNSNAIVNINNNNNMTLIRTISNSLLYINRTTSNALLACCRTLSNSILYVNRTNSNAILLCCRTLSNSILYLTKNNSNAIINLFLSSNTGLMSQIRALSNSLLYLNRVNSNALLACCRTLSNSILYVNRTNSNAIINISNITRTNSNAFARGIRNNSNAILLCCRTLSNALLECCTNNSNAIINIINTTNTNSLASFIRYVSNAHLFLERTDSATKLFLTRNNSNALLACCRANSNALLECCTNNSNAIINIINTTNTNSLASFIRYVSNAHLFLERTDSATKLFLTRNNSNALLACCRANSNALLECCTNNSNAIINIINTTNTNSLASFIRYVSNAHLFLERTDSATKLFLTRNNSNALLACCKNLSNSLLYLTTNNSNAIVLISNSSQMIASKLIIQNSNAINNIFNYNNSNSLISLIKYNSNALLYCCKNNSNAIIHCCENGGNGGCCCCPIKNVPLVVDQSMDSNCELCPPDTITVAKNITINGNGARVTFCNPGTPQFIVEPGVIVTLENITLSRINNTTFNIGQNAMIQIGKNVFFELSDDITFIGSAIPALSLSNNPILRVLGDVNNPNAFTIRGIGGRKVLEFLPLFINTQTGMQVLSTFDIGLATVVLENVEFIGLESVNVTRETIPNFGVFAGAFALDTQTIINLQTDPDIYPEVMMNFLVEGENNTLRFLNDNVTLTGFINFSSFLDSELHMAFDLGEKLITIPQITVGDNVIFLGSTDGRARLVFDDYSVQLNHLGSNSFVTDAHSFIGGRNITVLNFPIKQQSIDLIVDSSVNVTSPLPNAIDPSFIRLPRPARRVNDCITALDVLRARNDAEGERLRAELVHKMGVKKIPASYMSNHSKFSIMGSVADVVNHKPAPKQKQSAFIKPGKKQPVQKPNTNGPRRDIDLTDVADSELGFNQTRSFTVPLIQLTNNATGIQLSNANGVISVFNGSIPSFGVDTNLQLDLYMLGNATLVQGTFPTTLKQNDTIYVTGLKNTIVVKDQLTIDGTFNFNAGSELIFEFDSTGPTRLVDKAVFFNIDLLELPERTTLTFKGRGTAWFKDGMVISCGPSVPESTSCGPVVQQPANVTIQITDAARMKLSGTGTPGVVGSSIVTIEGQALIIVDDGGKVDIQGNQQLIICDKKEDNINIIVSDSGLIVLDATNVGGSAKAKMSLHEGSYSLYITQDGSLEIGSGGVFEINTLNNGAPSGTLTLLDLSDGGNLILKTAGLLNIGRNNVNISTGSDNLIEFNPVRASIEGDGIVQLAGTQFAGRLFNHEFPAAFTATAQQLVRALINQVPSLSFSTVFTDASGNQVLLNKDIDLYRTDLYILSQTIIGLLPGDVITGDDPSTGLVYGTNGGVQFTIEPNGNRT